MKLNKTYKIMNKIKKLLNESNLNNKETLWILECIRFEIFINNLEEEK